MKTLEKMTQLMLAWYAENKRDLPWRRDGSPYAVYVSEIMLQQTRVEAVKAYYLRFMDALPSVKALALAPEELLFKLWEGLGYYSRVRNMQKTARLLYEKRQGIFPKEEEELLALPGIGPYTASAIASIACGQKKAAVDGNVLRVLSRLFALEEDSTKASFRKKCKESLEKVMPEDTASFTQSWMELGALICTPRVPACSACPLSALCQAHAKGTETAFPIKPEKKKRKIQEKTVILLTCKDRVALHKREEGGLLSGLWEFPTFEGHLSLSQAQTCFGTSLENGMENRHVFTHLVWDMISYVGKVEKPFSSYQWVTREELASLYALPSAYTPFLSLLPF